MGLLPNLADNLSVSIPKADFLVTGYALSVAIGSPFVALATARMERKTALVLLMGVFTLGNLACALAPNYASLFAARVLTALCHGAFFGTGSIVAANVVPPKQRSQAIALMFMGLTLANVIGVPVGTAIGQAHGWRMAFWSIVPIGLSASLLVAALVPRQGRGEGGLLREVRILRRPQVILVLLMSMLASASLFCVFTYITPMLEQVTRLSPHAVTIVLLLFGVGITIGNLLGGRLSDWKQMPTVISTMAATVLLLIILYFVEPFMVATVATLLAWGLMQFTVGSPLQSRVVEKASEAPNLAATLNQGAFNFGNASGASMGGALIAAGFSYRSLPWASVAIMIAGLLCALRSAQLEGREAESLSEVALDA